MSNLYNPNMSVRDLIQAVLEGKNPVNVDQECGYPTIINPEDYRFMFDREGIGQRATAIYAEHCWDTDPSIFEVEDTKISTPFEEDILQLAKDNNVSLFSYLEQLDIESGIGRFGCMLFGIKDGKDLKEAVDGIKWEDPKSRRPKTELLYLRVFDESKIEIKDTEKDKANPRFGWPTLYKFTYTDGTTQEVHWSRVLHVSDRIGEPYHSPRQEKIYNRLLDLRKNYGGSAQSTWQGGFPGIALSPVTNGDITYEIDPEQVRTGMQKYTQGLSRYIALEGLEAKSLSTQVYDPTAPVEVQLKAIALILGIPYRIFIGTEEAQLAGSQDQRNWNKRIAKKQNKHCTPTIVRRCVDLLVRYGVVSPPAKEEYFVEWEDRNTMTKDETSKTALTEAQAIGEYVTSGSNIAIPLREFLSLVMGWDDEKVDLVVKAVDKGIKDGSIEDPADTEEPDPNAEDQNGGPDQNGPNPNDVAP